MLNPFRILLIWLFLPLQLAVATEYRKITLSDGRIITGQVLDSEENIMWVRTPRGKVAVDMFQVQSIENVTRSDYSHQKPLTVLLLPSISPSEDLVPVSSLIQDLVHRHLLQMPGLVVIESADFTARQGLEHNNQLSRCGKDTECVLALVEPNGIDIVIHGGMSQLPESPDFSLQTSGSPAHGGTRSVVFQETDTHSLTLQVGLHLLKVFGVDEAEHDLAIEGPSRIPLASKPAKPAKPRKPRTLNEPSRKVLERTALIPVPGLPALIQRDLKSFGLTWSVVVPTTVAMVAIVGQSTYRSPQYNVLSLLSYYALTVGANRRFGLSQADPVPVN